MADNLPFKNKTQTEEACESTTATQTRMNKQVNNDTQKKFKMRITITTNGEMSAHLYDLGHEHNNYVLKAGTNTWVSCT